MMKWIKSHVWLLTVLAVFLVAAAGGYRYYQSRQEAPAPVKTATVEYGRLMRTVSATGSLKALDNVDISSKITGRIVKVLVTENEHVHKGQLLLQLDDTALKATELQRKATLDNYRLTLERNRELLDRGAVSAQTYDNALMNYEVAKAAYEQAVSNTNDTNIYSPVDGYVIGKSTPVGQTISSGISTPQVIMSIANLDKMEIETLVDESDIGQVRVGQQVEFNVDAYPDKVFTGKVRLISRSAHTTNNVVYYKVYVDVDNAENKLFPNMTARASIILEEQKDTLMVPGNCIYQDGKRRYVIEYNEATGTEEEVDVTLGLSGDDKVAVKSSGKLRQGDKVVVKGLKGGSAKKSGSVRPPHPI